MFEMAHRRCSALSLPAPKERSASGSQRPAIPTPKRSLLLSAQKGRAPRLLAHRFAAPLNFPFAVTHASLAGATITVFPGRSAAWSVAQRCAADPGSPENVAWNGPAFALHRSANLRAAPHPGHDALT